MFKECIYTFVFAEERVQIEQVDCLAISQALAILASISIQLDKSCQVFTVTRLFV